MNTSDMKGAILWVIIGGTLGVVLGMWIGYVIGQNGMQNDTEDQDNTYLSDNLSNTDTSMSDGAVIGSSAPETGDGAFLSVNNQPAGHAVTVADLDMPRDGWIAVHEILDGAVIGNVLGAARRDAGVHTGVVIDLLRATDPGNEYALVLYADNGNKEFDLNSDLPITDAAGSPVVERFSTTVPPSASGN